MLCGQTGDLICGQIRLPKLVKKVTGGFRIRLSNDHQGSDMMHQMTWTGLRLKFNFCTNTHAHLITLTFNQHMLLKFSTASDKTATTTISRDIYPGMEITIYITNLCTFFFANFQINCTNVQCQNAYQTKNKPLSKKL